MKILSTLAASIIFGISAMAPSYAEDCLAPKAAAELSAEEMQILYDCLHPKFVAAFGKKDHEVGAAYGDWKAVSKQPAAPGVHSGQHLMTYVNDVGYDQYIKYNTDGTEMPIGTVIAKENFKIKDSGKIEWGALLVMTKVGDEAAETGGWIYSGVKTKGKKLKVDAKGFCHGCHIAYPGQDFLGYPIPEMRVN